MWPKKNLDRIGAVRAGDVEMCHAHEQLGIGHGKSRKLGGDIGRETHGRLFALSANADGGIPDCSLLHLDVALKIVDALVVGADGLLERDRVSGVNRDRHSQLAALLEERIE